MTTSLDDYARQQGYRSTGCAVCNAPTEVRQAVEENERKHKNERYPRFLLVDFAREVHSADISVDSIYRHTRDHT